MRKLRRLKERLTKRRLETRALKIEARQLDENSRFTRVWARERRIPDDFAKALEAGRSKRVLGPERGDSAMTKLMSLVTMGRRGRSAA